MITHYFFKFVGKCSQQIGKELQYSMVYQAFQLPYYQLFYHVIDLQFLVISLWNSIKYRLSKLKRGCDYEWRKESRGKNWTLKFVVRNLRPTNRGKNSRIS